MVATVMVATAEEEATAAAEVPATETTAPVAVLRVVRRRVASATRFQAVPIKNRFFYEKFNNLYKIFRQCRL